MVAREMSLTEILLVSASNGETVEVTEAWGHTSIAVEVSEAEENRTLVAVDAEATKATATSIMGDTKISSYFQQLQRLHHMRMS